MAPHSFIDITLRVGFFTLAVLIFYLSFVEPGRVRAAAAAVLRATRPHARSSHVKRTPFVAAEPRGVLETAPTGRGGIRWPLMAQRHLHDPDRLLSSSRVWEHRRSDMAAAIQHGAGPEREATHGAAPVPAAPDRNARSPTNRLMRLQRTVGNRFVTAAIRSGALTSPRARSRVPRRMLARQDESTTGPSTVFGDPSLEAEQLGNPYDTSVNRWITLDAPSLSLNAGNVTRMQLTRNPIVPWSMDAETMLTSNVDKKDKHLVFNCHGFQALPDFDAPHLSIGTVVHPGNVGAFGKIAGTVKVIWISACNIAGSQAGSDFCAAMAKNSGAYVVAATMATTQRVRKDSVEDTAGAMWVYFDPTGTKIARSAFIALGPSLGFTYEKKSR